MPAQFPQTKLDARAAEKEGRPKYKLLAITSIFDSPYHKHRAPYSAQLLERLAQHFELEIVRPIAWTDKWQRARDNDDQFRGGRWKRIPIHFPTYWFLPKLAPALNGIGYFLSIFFTLLLRTRRPDLVLSIWSYPDGFAALKWAKFLGVPCVVQVIGSDINTLAQLPATAASVRRVMQSAAGVLCVSEALRRKVIELGAAPARVHTVYTGIEQNKFFAQPRSEACRHLHLADTPRIIYIGNLKREKGIYDLIEALRHLKEKGVDFAADIIGIGDSEGVLAAIERNRIAENVTLRGARPHDELVDWIGASNCVCLPSYAEGVPNVVLEAMACERTVVATNVGGIPEVVDDSHLQLVEPGAVQTLAARLETALASEKNLTRFKVDVGNYDNMANIVTRVLLQALDKSAVSSAPPHH